MKRNRESIRPFLNSGRVIREIPIMPRKGQTQVGQASITSFTTRVTRRTARLKSTTLDIDNENIASIAPSKEILLQSPKRLQKSAPAEAASPSKIAKKEVKVRLFLSFSVY